MIDAGAPTLVTVCIWHVAFVLLALNSTKYGFHTSVLFSGARTGRTDVTERHITQIFSPHISLHVDVSSC